MDERTTCEVTLKLEPGVEPFSSLADTIETRDDFPTSPPGLELQACQNHSESQSPLDTEDISFMPPRVSM